MTDRGPKPLDNMGNPTCESLGVCEDFYDQRVAAQLPVDTRIGHPDRKTSMTDADIIRDSTCVQVCEAEDGKHRETDSDPEGGAV